MNGTIVANLISAQENDVLEKSNDSYIIKQGMIHHIETNSFSIEISQECIYTDIIQLNQIVVPNDQLLEQIDSFCIKIGESDIWTIPFELLCNNHVYKNNIDTKIDIPNDIFTFNSDNNNNSQNEKYIGLPLISLQHNKIQFILASKNSFQYAITFNLIYLKRNERFALSNKSHYYNIFQYDTFKFENKEKLSIEIYAKKYKCIKGFIIHIINEFQQSRLLKKSLNVKINKNNIINNGNNNSNHKLREIAWLDNMCSNYNYSLKHQAALYETLRMLYIPDEIICIIESYIAHSIHCEYYIPYEIPFYSSCKLDFYLNHIHSGKIIVVYSNVFCTQMGRCILYDNNIHDKLCE